MDNTMETLITEGTKITRYDKSRWVINTSDGRNILINEPLAQLYEILSEAPSMEEAHRAFNSRFQAETSYSSFSEIIRQKLGGLHILKADEEFKPSLNKDYLSYKLQLLDEKTAAWLSHPLQGFFLPTVFWKLLTAIVLFCSSVLAFYIPDMKSFVPHYQYSLLIFLVYPAVFIHELGHIAACARAGVRHGGIGYGFYSVFPVFYADISNIWSADKESRIIANLAGVVSEWMYAATLALIFLFTGDPTFWLAFMMVFIKALTELNPFIRQDGYWLLSDLTDTPNLLPKANEMMKKTLTINCIKNMIREHKLPELGRKEKLLLVYGLLNIVLLFLFSFLMLRSYADTIIYFPQIVWQLLVKAAHLHLHFADFKAEYILVAAFYALGIKSLAKLTNHFAKKFPIFSLKRVG